ncbi:MAG: hypothetical protein HY314_07065 [Acidobacteria bacterium]|nr:hypothetical protein [Acidobacteriota bacterium]
MAITYTIILRHGGTIDIKSEPDKGTIVILHLPVRMEQKPGG